MNLSKRSMMAILVVVIIVAASGAAYVLSSPSNGTLAINVKDAPTDWRHVNVTFSQVWVHEASGDNDSGWYNITITNGQIDLLAFRNASELLASSDIPAGKYTQIRIDVISVTGTMMDWTNVTFSVPSGQLKTTHPFEIRSGETQTLTLDFDLEHSMIQNDSGWTFKPVLGSISED